MCFSAQASFIAAALLSTIGIVSIIKARTNPLRFLASSTLLFGIQQALEGFVWLTFHDSTIPLSVQKIASSGFVFFALFVWPLCVPLLLQYLETNKTRKNIILTFLGAGILSTCCSIAGIYVYGIHPHIINHNISYTLLDVEPFGSYYGIYIINSLLYVLAVIGSLLTSSITYMWLIGIIVALGLGISIASFWHAFGSVWCFFGAITSLLVYCAIAQEQKKKKLN